MSAEAHLYSRNKDELQLTCTVNINTDITEIILSIHLNSIPGNMKTLVISLFFALTFLSDVTCLTGEWRRCKDSSGTCINTSQYRCSTSTLVGFCPGPSAVRCCLNSSGVVSTKCRARNGLCKSISDCRGSTVTGLCPGPSSFKCCISSSSTTSSSNGEWARCRGRSGTCINTGKYRCSTSTLTGLCPGPAATRCCPSPSGVVSTKCRARSGLCKTTSDCRGSTASGLCPGPSFFKCCTTSSTSGSSSSSGSSSTGTEDLDKRCSSNYMSKAGRKLTAEGWKISMRPTLRARLFARTRGIWNSMWRDLQKCVKFPPLSARQRQSLFEQMACHAKWGVTVFQGGRTWDYEAWRPSIGLDRALGGLTPPDHRCNWSR